MIQRIAGLPSWWMQRAPSARNCRQCLSTTTHLAATELQANKQKVIVIASPTRGGHNRLVVELAKRVDGEIISADSMQVYQGLDIGSEKPSISDREAVPHHLIDIMRPSQYYSKEKFFDYARRATEDILHRGRVPIVAGGTSSFLRRYVYGKCKVEEFMERGQWYEAVEHVVKAGDRTVRSCPRHSWHQLLRRFHKIRISNANQEKLDYDFLCFFISLPRIDLYRAIDSRCEEMAMDTGGLLSEASWLLDTHVPLHMNSPANTVNYREAMWYLHLCRTESANNARFFAEFLSRFKKKSRDFAKRQVIKFRSEPIFCWLDASRPLEQVVDFLCYAYCHGEREGEAVVVPEWLRLERMVKGVEETQELADYVNESFHDGERFERDCSHVLDWVQRTQERRHSN